MTLRRIGSSHQPVEVMIDPGEEQPEGWGYAASLRWRLAFMRAVLVAITVGVISVASYWTVSSSLTSSVDEGLEEKASTLLERAQEPGFYENVEDEIAMLKSYNGDLRVALSPPGWEYVVGDSIALPADLPPSRGTPDSRIISGAGGERIVVMSDETGAVVVMTLQMDDIRRLVTSLGVLLLIISCAGVLISILLGFAISDASLKPLAQLQRAVETVARTDQLRPIPVVGNDELARLTVSFNEMLEALRVSRMRQSQLVADAGHELKTPLTSMRTNIELLMMASRPGSPPISEQDRHELECDVLAQMEEMSTLIGDLVDLTREEETNVLEPVHLNRVLETAVERVERRRHDVEILTHTVSWYLNGDGFSLTRALVNVLDNAVKWSPENAVVRVSMKPIDKHHVQIVVEDSGPGIPEEEREMIFERFYRAVQSRSLPGSGLGLAIVRQVVDRHAGHIEVGESDDGGTKVTLVFPGTQDPTHLSPGQPNPQ
ncbi:two-component system sensor kinase [Corynebacterium efficiens YS-314]|uniref:histidine kinase n=2 Tax=Corynebacterium efficiens TaxID=152794 RepID=Q8FR18_COREF|nr:HAMP domain-containing sensor histidine kinase [Corynebacterium efficiens]BAC17759.1 two-component system sensor kinase [Corynebacterium efficiens YS-314]